MKTTADERKQAVAIARRLLDKSEPRILDIGECDLLCRVLIDCRDIFVVHAPVIEAVKKCVDRFGNVPREFAQIWQDEVTPAIKALHAYDHHLSARGG